MSENLVPTEPGMEYPAQESQSRDTQNDYRAQEAQLIISLKFHHSKTLSHLPLDAVLNAVVKVWDSCQDNSEAQGNNVVNEQAK